MKTLCGLLLLLLAACSRPPVEGEGAGGPAEHEGIRGRGAVVLAEAVQALSEAYGEVGGRQAVEIASAGIPALLDGTADLAWASRELNDRERAAAQRDGFEPVAHVIGFDAVVVYLHHDNTALSLSIPHLAEIFGDGGAVEIWGQLGLEIPGCYSDRVERFRLGDDSAMHALFRRKVLGDERGFKPGGRVMESPAELVVRVEKTPCAIGYSSLAFVVDRVKRACLFAEETDVMPADVPDGCVYPTTATAGDGSYPLTRPLIAYTRGKPRGAIRKFLTWVLSDAGQCVLERRGFGPVRPLACS